MTPSRVFWWYHNNCRCSAVMALFPYIAGDTYWLSRPPKCRCRPLYRISGGAVNSGFKNSWRYGPWYRDHDCFAIFMGFGMISFPFFSVDSFLFLLFFGTLSSPTGDFSLCPCSFLSFWCGLSHISELSHRGVLMKISAYLSELLRETRTSGGWLRATASGSGTLVELQRFVAVISHRGFYHGGSTAVCMAPGSCFHWIGIR